MVHEPTRPAPQSAVQATGQVAESIVGGLKGNPALLAIVVLNVAMIIALVFFMRSISSAVTTNRDQLLTMVSRCLDQQ